MGFISSAVGTLMGNRTDSGDIKNLMPQTGLEKNQDNLTYALGQQGRDMNGLASNYRGMAADQAQGQTANQQNQFINQLTQQANGQGPSVSQTLLNQALDRNTQNTNALMGSARGNVNPALLMRNAMNANANAGQNAAGQAMIGRQQEQLNAQAQLGNVLDAKRTQDIQHSGMYNQLAQNYSNLGLNGLNSQANAAGMNMSGGLQAYQTASDTARANTANTSKTMGGLMDSMGPASMMTLFKSSGGVIPEEASYLNAPSASQGSSPGGIGAGGIGKLIALMKEGGLVPGKAEVKGDSIKNDKVLTLLSPGEIVIPRTEAQKPDHGKQFLADLAKHQKEAKSKTAPIEYSQLIKTLADLKEALNKNPHDSKKGK